MRAQVASIPIDEKTGELILPRSPKNSPRRSTVPFSPPTRSSLAFNNNSPSQRYSPLNNRNNNNNDNGDEFKEIHGIDSIVEHAAANGTMGDAPSDMHKDTETVKSKTCVVM